MKREMKADLGDRDEVRGNNRGENQRTTDHRCEDDVRPELDALGWAARAQRLFAVALDA